MEFDLRRYQHTLPILLTCLEGLRRGELTPARLRWFHLHMAMGQTLLEQMLGGVDPSKQTEPRFPPTSESGELLQAAFAFLEGGPQKTFADVDRQLRAMHTCFKALAEIKTPVLPEEIIVTDLQTLIVFFTRLKNRAASDGYSSYMAAAHDPSDDE